MVDSAASEQLPRLVVDDREQGIFRVHHSAMTSPEVWALERERIFAKCWVYVCHDSEVEAPGDFVTRDVVGRPTLVVRDARGNVNCFFNTCPHRGAMVCREERGNAKRFTCFYHAWTFDATGQLVSLPQRESYGPDFDWSERCLVGPARFEQYRGFWFMNLDPEAESLSDYLADAKEYLDLIVDQSSIGMRVLPGTHEYEIGANWKLLCENSLDGTHAPILHQTYFKYIQSLGSQLQIAEGSPPRQLGNGHSVIEGPSPFGRPIALWDPVFGEEARADIEAIRAEIFASHDEAAATRMCDTFRLMLIFPNLIVHDITAITIRSIDPVAPDRMRVTSWALAPKEEAGDRLARRIDSYLTFLGPGGFASPDDAEALESCQRGFTAVPGGAWSDVSKGMQTAIPMGMDELQMRAFWRAWAAYMNEEPVPPIVPTPECSQVPTSVSP